MNVSGYSRSTIPMLLLGALLLVSAACRPGGDSPEEDFAQRYRAAQQSGDPEAMLALYHWHKVEDSHRFFVRQAIEHEFEYPVLSIRFSPPEADDTYRYTYQGQDYVPNLPTATRVEIAFDSPEHMHISSLLGLHEGKLYFINPQPAD